MDIVVFGTGKKYQKNKAWLQGHNIVALLDNDVNKQGTTMDGVLIVSPEKICNLQYDYIVILSVYIDEMVAQLQNLGVNRQLVLDGSDLGLLKRIKETYYYGVKPRGARKRLVLISWDMSLSGAQIVLMYAAEILIQNEYDVIVVSSDDGPLRDECVKRHIPVIIDENIKYSKLADLPWVADIDMVFLNTFNMHYLLVRRNKDIPVLWWIHESPVFETYFPGYQKTLDRISMDNIYTYTVGAMPYEWISKTKINSTYCGMLPYGLPDMECKIIVKSPKDRLIFATVGWVCERKSQDILYHAIEKLPDDIKSACEFWVVGCDENEMGEWLHQMASSTPELKIMGQLDRDEIQKLYTEIDVLLCPSREDTMPVVVNEAMMNCIPVVVSDKVGNAKYITEKVNGLVVSVDAESLAEGIEWCVRNRDKLDSIGKRGRKVFEDEFSLPAFSKRLLQYVEGAFNHGK
ncbi:glycosyltransferase family 4 protein [Anaerovibrio sp. RM50]|uniref:glycosyltransferase family 4 protein n=1 Tax=Anaerovibrio sp. RM50 TaxID=1200557 RepID=UPI000480FB96|nr:glycosyltransferase family 4 protein [Anaerovibrio sp. RM50]